MVKVYDLTGQRLQTTGECEATTSQSREVSVEEFMELLTTCERYVDRLRPLRKDQEALDRGLKIIKEMKFNAMFNSNFRKEYIGQLEEFLDTIFLEINRGKL